MLESTKIICVYGLCPNKFGPFFIGRAIVFLRRPSAVSIRYIVYYRNERTGNPSLRLFNLNLDILGFNILKQSFSNPKHLVDI